MASSRDFTTIRTEGGLLPPNLLKRLRDVDADLPGLTAESYHVIGTRHLTEAITEAWNKLQGAWATFQEAYARPLPKGDGGTSITRERWLLPLFQVLDYGRLEPRTAATIDHRSYPISHGWRQLPIHLVSFTVDLDRRKAGVAGAARSSPHSLVQSYLNGSEDHLWGVVSNGLKLRLLRDNRTLTRPAYLEFDLEAMFKGEVYSDFILLYLTLHESRFEQLESGAHVYLEQWAQHAQQQGTRALNRLRGGVQRALNILGQGYLEHRENSALRQGLQSGSIKPHDYYRQLLRVVYRLLVLFTAEDRGLLHPEDVAEEHRQRFDRYYSTRRLRELADSLPGSQHTDLYELLKRVWGWLGADGAPGLGLPALGGFLFSAASTSDLNVCHLTNRYLLSAIRALAFAAPDGGGRFPVDYKNLGAEELGSIYESLLELHPEVDTAAQTFSLRTMPGNERKTTGSYYTSTNLINVLLDSALEPVLDATDNTSDREAALLDLKVVDPASGSGHFLIAAAQRIARRLARVRTQEDEPGPEATRHALRDAISHCIYGVDVNDMAAELCKVALWLEALEPGKPLTFLDHHIKTGNSLLGAPPQMGIGKLVEAGIPDDAYKPIQGDDKATTRRALERNREERRGQGGLFGPLDQDPASELAHRLHELNDAPDADVARLHAKEATYRRLLTSQSYSRARTIADAWVAAFVWPKDPTEPEPITSHDLRGLLEGHELDVFRQQTLTDLTHRYQFFHWGLEFADAFERPNSGFDVVLGNPPWERIKLQEREWFATREPDIASAPNAAARNRLIRNLKSENPAMHSEFLTDLRKAEGESHIVRNSGIYPLCGRGDVNTYAVFAELDRNLLNPGGRAGFVVPSGIATDATTQHFFRDITENHMLVSLMDFWEIRRFFPGTDSRNSFCLMTLTGSRGHQVPADLVFGAHAVSDLANPERHFELSADDIALLNPNTRTCPTFLTRRDAELTKTIHKRVPILISEAPPVNAWKIQFMTMFHMANDSRLFRTRGELEAKGFAVDGNWLVKGDDRFAPLYEAKMVQQYDDRFATFKADGRTRDTTSEEHEDPNFAPLPRYWVSEEDVLERLQDRKPGEGWREAWLLAFRNITNASSERTAVFTLVPRSGVGHSLSVCLLKDEPARDFPVLLGALSSYAFDYTARQKAGGNNFSYFILKQLPVPSPTDFGPADRRFVASRVQELVGTSRAISAALGLEHPLKWDPERRFWIRAELDAFYFRKYGLSRDDVAYIMETFPLVKRRDEESHGCFRTKDAILEVYDELARCEADGREYTSRASPLPEAAQAGSHGPT